jgi:hypothetical protein
MRADCARANAGTQRRVVATRNKTRRDSSPGRCSLSWPSLWCRCCYSTVGGVLFPLRASGLQTRGKGKESSSFVHELADPDETSVPESDPARELAEVRQCQTGVSVDPTRQGCACSGGALAGANCGSPGSISGKAVSATTPYRIPNFLFGDAPSKTEPPLPGTEAKKTDAPKESWRSLQR